MTKNEKIQTAFEKIYLQTDTNISYMIYGAGALVFLVGAVYAQPVLALASCAVFMGLFFLGTNFFAQRSIKNLFVCFSFTALLLSLLVITKGLTEIRFIYFILMLVLILYLSDAVVHFSSALAYIFIVASYSIILSNNPFKDVVQKYVLEKQATTIERFLIAFSVIVLMHMVSIFIIHILKKRTLTNIINQIEQEEQLAYLQKNKSFADAIASGDFDSEYMVDEVDILGKSLFEMRLNLKKSAIRDEQDKFISIGIAGLSEILRTQNESIYQLSEKVLSYTAGYMQASQGGLYVINTPQNQPINIEMTACYAYNRNIYFKQKISAGEGLVGQCYLEKKSIFLTNIPPSYPTIKSGLGEMTASNLLIIPLLANQNVLGILELAFVEKLEDYQHNFLKKVAEDLAITLIAVKTNEETKRLYEQTRITAEELQSSEEELRQNMEEMQATQEEMERTQKRMKEERAKNEAFFNGSYNPVLSFRESGNLEDVNIAAAKTFGYEVEEIKEMNIIDIIPELKNKIFDNILGKRYEMQAIKKNGRMFLLRTFFNMVMLNNRPLYILYARDISDDSIAIKKLTDKIKELENQKN